MLRKISRHGKYWKKCGKLKKLWQCFRKSNLLLGMVIKLPHHSWETRNPMSVFTFSVFQAMDRLGFMEIHIFLGFSDFQQKDCWISSFQYWITSEIKGLVLWKFMFFLDSTKFSLLIVQGKFSCISLCLHLVHHTSFVYDWVVTPKLYVRHRKIFILINNYLFYCITKV